MSSPLDGRIRKMAREEAIALLGDSKPDLAITGPDRVAELEMELTELRATVQRFEERLQTVEKPVGQADQEARSATRRTRGTSG